MTLSHCQDEQQKIGQALGHSGFRRPSSLAVRLHLRQGAGFLAYFLKLEAGSTVGIHTKMKGSWRRSVDDPLLDDSRRRCRPWYLDRHRLLCSKGCQLWQTKDAYLGDVEVKASELDVNALVKSAEGWLHSQRVGDEVE